MIEIKEFTKDRIDDVIAFEHDLRREEGIWGWEIDDLIKKLGMKLEGIQRSQVKDNHGNWQTCTFTVCWKRTGIMFVSQKTDFFKRIQYGNQTY